MKKIVLLANHDSRFDGRDRRIIESAMEELECGSCIKFNKRTTEASYVHILPDKWVHTPAREYRASFERIPFNLYLRKRNIPPHPFCPCCQHMSFRRCITEKNKGWCEYLTDSLKWRQDDPALKQRIKMSFQPCKTIQPFQSTFAFMSVDRKIMKRTDTEW